VKQLILDVRPDFTPTLANFVPGDNAPLVAALREQLTRQDGSLLYIWGPTGSGRSHLLHAAIATAHDQRPARFVSTGDDMASPGEHGLLCVDDLGAQSETSLAELFRIMINARERQQSLIVAGSEPPARLLMRDDVSSRIAQGLIFEMRPLTDEQKIETLMQHASSRGMRFTREMVGYLLRRSRRDLPWLMAVLDALDEASLSLGRPITLPLLREILRAE
jgi:DnaA family protein